MLVVLYHFREAIEETSSNWVTPWISNILEKGYLGVDIFFVISGFVISYSVRNGVHTPGFLFRFSVRRSIRLDPSYWLTIILELLLIKIGLLLFPALGTDFPSIDSILAHFVYLQGLLGYSNIVAIFWTLCYEVQFYLVFVTGLVAIQAVRQTIDEKSAKVIALIVSAISFIWSVAVFFGPVEPPISGLFIDRWFQFFIGFLAMRCVLQQKLTIEFFLGSFLIVVGILAYPEVGFDNGTTALVISWSLVVAAVYTNYMSIWLSGNVSQFLGRISYSLYLIHPVIGWRFIKLLHKFNGEDFSPFQAWLALAAGVGVSILSAWLMYKLVESSSLRVCHRIRMDQPLTLKRFKESLRPIHSKRDF